MKYSLSTKYKTSKAEYEIPKTKCKISETEWYF